MTKNVLHPQGVEMDSKGDFKHERKREGQRTMTSMMSMKKMKEVIDHWI